MTMEVELPLDIWKTVCSFLPLKDKRAVRQVAHLFRDAADESTCRAFVMKKAESSPYSVAGTLLLMSTRLHWINNLSLETARLSTPDLEVLHTYSCLTTLTIQLHGSCCSDEALKQLAHVSQLRSLKIAGATFESPAGLDTLKVLPRLSELTLHNCKPQTLEMMTAIGSLTGLLSLEILRPYCFQDLGYSQLSCLTKLQALSLGCSWMLGTHKEPLDFLYHLQKLTQLSLRRCFASDESLAPLASLMSLRHLSLLHLHRVNGEGFTSLLGLNKLQSLNLCGCGMLQDSCLTSINNLQGLSRLDLGSGKLLTGKAVSATLEALPKLKELIVPSTLKIERQRLNLDFRTSYRPDAMHIILKGQLEENLRSMLVTFHDSPLELSNANKNLVLRWFADNTIP